MTAATLRSPEAATSSAGTAFATVPRGGGSSLGVTEVRVVPDGPVVNGLAIVLARWAVVLVGAVAVARSSGGPSELLWGAPLVAIAAVRTMEVRYVATSRQMVVWVGIVVELTVTAVVVVATGGVHSGWAVVLVGDAALTGCLLPSRLAGTVASGGAIGLVLFNVADRAISGTSQYRIDFDALLVAVALATAYASWVLRHGERDRVVLAEENGRLMATNDLLVTLEHAVLRSDGLSDPQAAARAVTSLVQELLEPDVVVVVTAGAVPGTWRVLLSDGATLTPVVDRIDALALLSEHSDRERLPLRLDGQVSWLADGSRSGLCAPLLVRDRLIGAVIVEHPDADRWDDRAAATLRELATWAGLLIDNACRFNALWVAGAADERARIARDLHDHLGQSMAALGLELDGIARQLDDERAVHSVRDLRQRVTTMVAELRFTMRELRSDVSADRDLETVLGDLIGQLNKRFDTSIQLSAYSTGRLPLTQEHQLLLMARRILTGAIQAQAGRILVFLTGDSSKGCLEIEYDGTDIAPGGLYEVAGSPMLDTLAEVKLLCDGVGAGLDYERRDDGRSVVSCRVLR